MERFSCKTQIVSGPGAVAYLAELGAKRLFLVTDPFFQKNGTAARIAAAAKAQAVEIFDGVMPDPSVALAAEGTARVKKFAPDLIVALGGGSAMDCAKAMAYFAQTGAKLAAIPTTSGSGSEVTDFAILTHDRVKHPLVDESLLPDVAVLDSDLLAELPASLIADAGFDVLSHAAESYVAKNSGAITQALAADAFCRAYHQLTASFTGNKQVRSSIHVAATMAGMAFSQAGLGLCHAMAHSIGGRFHIPHGRLNAILLPAVIMSNAGTAQAQYAQLARAAGLGGSADAIALRNLKNGLVRLRKELNLPATLAEAGVKPAEVRKAAPEIVEAALKDPCCDTNPSAADAITVRRILEEVTGRV